MSERFSEKRLVAFAFISTLLYSACASGARDLMKRASAESRQSLAAGDFQKAIDALKEPFQRNPRSKEWAADFARAVEDIHATADRAVVRKDYVLAERMYSALLGNYADFGAFATNLTFQKNDLEAAVKYCRISLIDGLALQDLKAGDYTKALDAYSAVLKEYPGDNDLAARYLRTVREVKAAGDKALVGKDFAQAGKLDSLLFQRYPFFEGMKPGLPFGRPDLAAALAICRDGLTKAGLAEYRKGDLARAIAVWEALLAFDPGNTEIKKAVDTAKTQLKGIDRKKIRTRRPAASFFHFFGHAATKEV